MSCQVFKHKNLTTSPPGDVASPQAGWGNERRQISLNTSRLEAPFRRPGVILGSGSDQMPAWACSDRFQAPGAGGDFAGFTRSATDYVAKSPKRIVLIDGEELARLMVVHEIGVRTRIRYAVKRIDEDYFDGEDL